MLLKFIYVVYWIVLGVLIWHYEKKIAMLEEENRHVKALLDIAVNRRNRTRT